MIGQPEIYDALGRMGIDFHYAEHPPTPTIDEARKYWSADEGKHCKNIFLRNHKGTRHYLVILDCERSISMSDLEKRLGEGKLSFASPERLMRYLGVRPGSVSPLGLVNDKAREVIVFVDANLGGAELLAFHPNDNRVSLSITQADFRRFLGQMGNRCEWRELY